MQGHPKKLSSTARYLILLGSILFAANIILGLVMMRQAISTISSMVRNSMLSVSTTAAALLNGDDLQALTADDVGSPAYNEIYEDLSAFQKNVNIEYIYAVRRVGEDSFIFTVDPDPVNPGEFGEEVLVTDALRTASTGTAAVDNAPAEDEWGNFYSAYAPVFNSAGEVAGIVGVDFNAVWYEDQMRENSWSIVLVTVLSVAVASLIIFFITRSVRKQFKLLNDSISVFSSDIDELEAELSSEFSDPSETSKAEETPEAAPLTGSPDPEIEEVKQKMNSMHKKIRHYLSYMKKKASTDALTHVGNSTAYSEALGIWNAKIQSGTADFAVAVFDLNNLKPVNDDLGHIYGDRIIKEASRIVASVFGSENTFRIGGDEFLVILENVSEADIKSGFQKIDQSCKTYSEKFSAEFNHSQNILSIAKGYSFFRPGTDRSFKDVFSRADKEMYYNKGTFLLL